MSSALARIVPLRTLSLVSTRMRKALISSAFGYRSKPGWGSAVSDPETVATTEPTSFGDVGRLRRRGQGHPYRHAAHRRDGRQDTGRGTDGWQKQFGTGRFHNASLACEHFCM
jgi:hypothetical protein